MGDPGLKRLVGTAPLPPASSGRRLPQTPGACGPRGTTHDPVDRPFGAPRPRSRALPIGRCSEDRVRHSADDPRDPHRREPSTQPPLGRRAAARTEDQPRWIVADLPHSQPTIWTLLEFTADESLAEELADALARGSRPRPRMLLRLPNQDRDVRRPLRTRLPLKEARQRGARASGDVCEKHRDP